MALIKKILSLSLIHLMVFQSTMLLGMEPDKSGNVLKGTITIIPNPMCYIGSCPDYSNGTCDQKAIFEAMFNTTFKYNEPLVEVGILKGKNTFLQVPGEYGGRIGKVPLSLIDGKTKNDTFVLHIYRYTVTLKCDQSAYRCGRFNKKKFEDYLQELKKSFANNPNWLVEEFLVKKGILVKTGALDKYGKPIYKNGNNGFRENDTQENRKN